MRKAEVAKFDFVFIVDSQYITPDFPNHHLDAPFPDIALPEGAGEKARVEAKEVATRDPHYA